MVYLSMICSKCGHSDSLALFTSILCVSDACEFYDASYALEKGYKPEEEKTQIICRPPDALELARPVITVANDRCAKSGNYCGTDTWAIGYTCNCDPCQKWFHCDDILTDRLSFSKYTYDFGSTFTWSVNDIPVWPGSATWSSDWIYSSGISDYSIAPYYNNNELGVTVTSSVGTLATFNESVCITFNII